jgi:hypothetical protein
MKLPAILFPVALFSTVVTRFRGIKSPQNHW